MLASMDKTPFVSTAGVFTSLTLAELNEGVALAIGVATLVYICIKVRIVDKELKDK